MTDSRTKTPPPANRVERRDQERTRRPPLAFVLVPIALVAAGVVLILVLGGGKGGGLPFVGGDEPVPEFSFKVADVDTVGTAPNADETELQARAAAVVDEVAPMLDTLFTAGFLDPNNWKDGAYDEAAELFTDAATPSVEVGSDVITLGASAGETYASVAPRKGSLRLDVLFDKEGQPDTIAAHVRFYALGERTDGTFVSIVSHGVMFVRDQGNGWKVAAYDMKRNDRETEAPSPAAGTGGATGAGTGASG